jgi:class 3 adenylate cyclase
MPEAPGSTAAAAAVFLSIADFARRPVAEQAAFKERLESLAAAAIAPLHAAHRIVLDTAEGLAVVVLGSPELALDLAERALRKAHGLPVRIGINHGPVRLAAGPRNDPQLVGDGLVVAAAVASFAQPGRLLVSRSFRNALATVDPDRAEGLCDAGTFTDSQVRTHEVFAPDQSARSARRRRALMVSGLSIAGILAAGVAIRAVRHARRMRRPAVVELMITPWGELIVDGERKGRTPPLRELEVTPGHHTLEVRNGANTPLTLNVDLAPGENIVLRHDFPIPRARQFLRDQRRAEGER